MIIHGTEAGNIIFHLPFDLSFLNFAMEDSVMDAIEFGVFGIVAWKMAKSNSEIPFHSYGNLQNW